MFKGLNSGNARNIAPFLCVSSAAAVLLAAALATPAWGEGAAVPWLNQTAAEPPAAQAAATPAQRPCAAGDLQVVLGQQGAHHGFATQEIRITNRSSDKCSFTGFPSTKIEHDSQTPQALKADSMAPQVGTERVDLDPGEDAIMLVGAPGACEASADETKRKVATRVQLALPGGQPKLLEGAHIDTLCGAATVLRFEPAPNGAASNLKAAVSGGPQTSELTGTVKAPEAAKRGDTLRYTVTLANPTAGVVSLVSCPSYTQSLYSEGKIASTTMRLNCNGAGAKIAAHSSADFEMELPVPAGMAAGDAKLSWVLQNGPGVGAIITLR